MWTLRPEELLWQTQEGSLRITLSFYPPPQCCLPLTWTLWLCGRFLWEQWGPSALDKERATRICTFLLPSIENTLLGFVGFVAMIQLSRHKSLANSVGIHLIPLECLWTISKSQPLPEGHICHPVPIPPEVIVLCSHSKESCSPECVEWRFLHRKNIVINIVCVYCICLRACSKTTKK